MAPTTSSRKAMQRIDADDAHDDADRDEGERDV